MESDQVSVAAGTLAQGRIAATDALPNVLRLGTENEASDELNNVDLSNVNDTPSPSQMRLLTIARTQALSLHRRYCSDLKRRMKLS